MRPINILYSSLFVSGLLLLFCGCKEGKTSTEASIISKGGFSYRQLSKNEINHYKNEIEAECNKLLGSNFSGAVLVAKNGEVLYEAYKGNVGLQNNQPIGPTTPLHLASISKTFTGTTILRLWESGRISLDDSLQKFFPKFPYQGITVRMLLSHRSGLPNYLHFLDSAWDKHIRATNMDVLNYMIERKPAVAAFPNRVFSYCNTNYVLLALIIEKVTKQSYPEYMQDSVFRPLGMMNTFVFSSKDTLHYTPTYLGNRPYPMDHLDCTYGDKNIYSTVEDMFMWDRALYEQRFVKKAILDSAFKPLSNEKRSMHNYGLGWRLLVNGRDTLIYHNGKWHGSNTVFARFIQDTATIIVLGNRYNQMIYHAKQLGEIFTGKRLDVKLED